MTHMARNEGVINLSFNWLVGEYHIWISKYDQQYNDTVDCIDDHADVLRSKLKSSVLSLENLLNHNFL